jgi:hypothetical protein
MDRWGYVTPSGTGAGVISYMSDDQVITYLNGTGITIGRATGTNNVTITNTGVTSLSGLSGSISLSTQNTGTYPGWSNSGNTLYYSLPSGSSGQVLKHNGIGWTAGTDNTSTYSWSLKANGGSSYVVANTWVIDFKNSTGISWAQDFSGGITATLSDQSATNEIQGFIHSGTGSYTGTLSPSNGGVGERILLNTSGHKMVISHNGSGAVTFSTDDAYASVEGSSSLSLSGSFQTATFNTGLSYSAGSISTSSSGVTVNSTGAYEISFTAQIDHGAPTLNRKKRSTSVCTQQWY